MPSPCAVVLIFGFLAAAAWAAESSPAYREEIRTPHWQWVDQHAGGTIDVLFITSFLGGREPEELAQRFDIEIKVVPVSANPSAISTDYDEAYLAKALAAKPDVIVVSYRGAWSKLSEEALSALANAVAEGTPLIALSAANAPEALRKDPRPELERQGEEVVERNLAVQRLHFPWGREGGRIGLNVSRSGAGHFINVGMGHGAGGKFNSFIPGVESPPATPAEYEIAYAVFARLIRWAANKQTGPVGTLTWQGTPTLGSPLPVTVTLSEPAAAAISLEWDLHSPFGERLAQGAETIPAGTSKAVSFDLPLHQTGDLTIQYRLRSDSKVTDFGAAEVHVPSPLTNLEIDIPDLIAAEDPVSITWLVEGDSEPVDGFLLQVYDASDRLVSWMRRGPDVRECRLEGWHPQDIRHRLRMLALDEAGSILHEERAPLDVQLDRSLDPSRFHVMAWATEAGDPQEQWRYHRLRQLGITALSPIGTGMGVPEMAAAAGLRLAPVNICVPPGRFKKAFDPVKERAALTAYSQAIAPLSPLGYSLADEPSGVDLAAFRNWAADIIQQHDPGARVGYCGTHMKVGMDVPRILANCDFMIHYSPHYLYTSDLWRGIERDLHRSFTPKGGLNTAYTHYVPWADHEPYCRTVPWLLLFEEANGISYFASAGGNFSILGSDLRTTHETRWWSEEIRELRQGIATQLISMQREHGGIALLFPTDLPEPLVGSAAGATTLWAEALRELNLSFTFVRSGELAKLEPGTTPLLICPPAPVLASDELEAVQRYVEAGGVLVATAPFALVAPQQAKATEPPFWEEQPEVTAKAPLPELDEPRDDAAIEELLEGAPVKEQEAPPPPPVAASLFDIEPLFGLRRQPAGTAAREELFEAIAMRSRIPAEITWVEAGAELSALEGRTAGESGLIATEAEVSATFPVPDDDAPEFAKDAFSSPAAFRVRRGRGTAWYLNVVPTAASARSLAQHFRTVAGAAPAPAQVTVGDSPAPAVYLYPMVGGGVRTLGIIQDYERVKPALENREVQTAIYHNHGPLRWAEQNATLKLDQPVHLYDMRRKRYLGEVATADFLLRPGRPELFALLPYKVTDVEVSAAGSISAGAALQVDLRIATESGSCGDHTVLVRFAPNEETIGTGFTGTFRLQAGKGTVTVPSTFSDPNGEWLLQVTDVLTGIHSETEVRIKPPGNVGPLLPRNEVQVEKIALDWPRGEWKPYQDPETETRSKVDVGVGTISRTPINYGPFSGMICLHAKRLIGLQSRQANYQFTYMACNDWKKKGWEDERRIQAHSLSGLGMNRPAGHLWYYNGYIDIYYDDVRVTGYRIAEVKEVDAGEDGRVDVSWESPAGEAVLSFGLTLTGEPLLQQLQVRPSVAVESVRVEFRSYIGGFGNSETRYVRTSLGRNANVTDPRDAPWAFYADDVNDQAYGKGMGAGAILILPDEWDRVQYGITGRLEKKVDLQPGQTAAFHWALWLYPELTNEEAFTAFEQSRDQAKNMLTDFFGGQN